MAGLQLLVLRADTNYMGTKTKGQNTAWLVLGKVRNISMAETPAVKGESNGIWNLQHLSS